MPPGRPRTGRATYAFVRLREETHKLWLEAKRSLAASSDACCLLQNIRRSVSSSALEPLSTPVAEVVGTTQSSDLSVVAGQHRCDDIFLCSTPVHSSTRNESRLVSSDRRGERLKHPVLFRAEEEESSSDCEATPQLQQECNRQAEDSTLTSVSIIDHPSTMLADGYWQQSNWQAEESTLTSVSTIDYSSTMLAEESSQQSGSVCTSDEIRTVQNASYILNGTSSESDDDTYIVSDDYTSECSSGSEDVEEELESNEISVQGIEGANIKVLCNLDKLLMLFSGKCHKPGCVENCSIATDKVIGCCVLIHSQCTNKHIFVWKSSEMLTSRTNNKLFQNNLLFASAIIISGQSYYKNSRFCKCVGVIGFIKLFLSLLPKTLYMSWNRSVL
ncbi:serine-rich adhesin for platelets-like isoform X2 [Dysidea avara]|uniref:serine-rich adhesin for platelets-like isoform X2 n=1 Tax=Dysidea avara TaxID=196820 RepID=UPI003329E6AE